jgi:hypothetical protein
VSAAEQSDKHAHGTRPGKGALLLALPSKVHLMKIFEILDKEYIYIYTYLGKKYKNEFENSEDSEELNQLLFTLHYSWP